MHPAAAGVAVIVAAMAASGDRRLAALPDGQAVAALAPFEILASGFRQASAAAVEPDGAVLVADRAAGTVTRISSRGRQRLLEGLREPAGLALDGAGRMLVVEAAARRLVRIGADGVPLVIAAALRQPGVVAVGPDGRIWAALRDDGRGSDDLVVGVEESGGLTELARGLFEIEALVAAPDALHASILRLADEHGPRRTKVVRIAPGADGAARVEPMLSTELHHASGLGMDAVGDLFVAGSADDAPSGRSGVILKRHRTGGVTGFARGVDEAVLAFAPGGDLFAVEPRHPGRVIRFRAAAAPLPAVPAFTNQAPLPITGRAQPGDRVDLTVMGTAHAASAAIADAQGTFTIVAPLAPNAATELRFRATGAGGLGLAGPRATAVVVHDDVLPRVATVEPASAAHVRGAVVVRARAEDEGSGVATVSILLDDVAVGTVANPRPPAPLVATAVVQTIAVPEGPHTLTAAAIDRAGNSRSAAQLLVVDRTPPDTSITSGPGAETPERAARFGVSGSDVWSPAVEFSWRLDEGGWSPFTADSVVELRELEPGPHRFEVRARDLAGNEDPTPAVYAFTVRPFRVRILEPRDGAVIVSSSVWIRGVVDGGTGDVAVRLALPSAAAGTIAASVEAGMFAMAVPADLAGPTVTVLAADGSGAVAQASVAVVIAPDNAAVEPLDLWPPGGLAPLTVRIGLHGFSQAPLSVDTDGDGTDEFSGVAGADDFLTTYTRPGVYVPAVRVVLPDGASVMRRGLVEVYDRDALDARLRAVWAGFKDALRAGDVDAAVSFIVAGRRDAWAAYFRLLDPGALRDVDEIFPAIALVEAGASGAQYEMVAARDGLLFSYAVWFQVDADGRWRLSRF